MLKPTDKDKIPFKLENPIHYKIGDDFNPYYETNNGWQQITGNYAKGNTKSYTPVMQWFAQNLVPFYKQLGWLGHNGIDLKAMIGTRVFSMCDGIVDSISEDWGAIWIVTDTHTVEGSKLRFKVAYGHLSDIDVEIGQVVKTGDFIGLSGNKGQYTTGPHLHIQVSPMYLNSRGRWYEDLSNGYAGAMDFILENYNIKYKQPMKHLRTHKEIVDTALKAKVALGLSEANFKKVQNGDAKLIKRIQDEHFGLCWRPEAHGEFYILQ